MIALRTSSGSTRPYWSTGRYVTVASPLRSSARQVSRIGLVLGHLGDDVVALVLVELDHAPDRQVVRLGGAAGEDDVLRLGADQPGHLLAAGVDGLLGLPAEAVGAAGGVAEDVGEVRQHRLQHARIDRRGGVVVHVDRVAHHHFRLLVRTIRTCSVLTMIREPRRVKEVSVPDPVDLAMSEACGPASGSRTRRKTLRRCRTPRSAAISSGVPAATTGRPASPPSGPRSIT